MRRIFLLIILLIVMPVSQAWSSTDIDSNDFMIASPEVGQGVYVLEPSDWNQTSAVHTAQSGPLAYSSALRTTLQVDKKYLSPSSYVNYNTPSITTLVDNLALDGESDYEKVTLLHTWITNHIAYDYEAHFTRSIGYVKASQVLTRGKGLCSGYSFLFAAMCRYAGIPCQVIHGMARENLESPWGYHAWNAVWLNGQWLPVDATWDAGYIKNGQFIFQCTTEFFLPDATIFSQTHMNQKITTY